MDHQKLVNVIMDLDENIRFATVCDMDGNMKVKAQREGVENYLSPQDTQDTLTHATGAWKSRMKHYDKIGKGLYTLAVYEKLRRVTLPLSDNHLLLVTIDNKGAQKEIVDRILNQLYGDYTQY